MLNVGQHGHNMTPTWLQHSPTWECIKWGALFGQKGLQTQEKIAKKNPPSRFFFACFQNYRLQGRKRAPHYETSPSRAMSLSSLKLSPGFQERYKREPWLQGICHTHTHLKFILPIYMWWFCLHPRFCCCASWSSSTLGTCGSMRPGFSVNIPISFKIIIGHPRKPSPKITQRNGA